MSIEGVSMKTYSALQNWTREEVGSYTLFYEGEEDGKGFEFKVLSFVSCVSTGKPKDNDHDISFDPERECMVDCILESGGAYFDGCRHLSFSSLEFGYTYYPDFKSLSLIFKRLMELEEKYCSYPHWK